MKCLSENPNKVAQTSVSDDPGAASNTSTRRGQYSGARLGGCALFPCCTAGHCPFALSLPCYSVDLKEMSTVRQKETQR